MTFSNEERIDALLDLVKLRTPVNISLSRLSRIDWNADDPVTLVRGDVSKALAEYSAGRLDDNGIELWAESVHTRDDIVFNPEDGDLLAEAIFKLSTPELFGGRMPEIVTEVATEIES